MENKLIISSDKNNCFFPIYAVQLSEEQIESLNKQANIFKDYVKGSSPKKEFAGSLLDSLKSAVNCVIQNVDSIQKLVNAGTSIVNILFKC